MKTHPVIFQKNDKFFSFIFPSATAFIGSFCIMVIEIVAGRLVAPYLGSSLYTWTAIIGIVLAGVAVGNYWGGVLADKGKPLKILGIVFFSGALAALSVPFLNQIVGEMPFSWTLPWRLRIALHLIAVFSIPSVILGIIAPVVTKYAVEKSAQVGHAVGKIYFWSAAGSIAGTFTAGYFLIPLLGIATIILIVSILLGVWGLFAILLGGQKIRGGTGFVLVFFLIITLAPRLPEASGSFRHWDGAFTVYKAESHYSHIRVLEDSQQPHIRRLVLDRVLNSIVDMTDPASIEGNHQYAYLKIYAAVTRLIASADAPLRALVLGGGGYVFPRYLKKQWPRGMVDVVEIDPKVTEAAFQALGLDRNPDFAVHHVDARHFVNTKAHELKQENEAKAYNIIYSDVISGLIVPPELVTYEFNQKIKSLLTPNGVYLINMIDMQKSGRLLAAMIPTMKKAFPFFYTFAAAGAGDLPGVRNTFVLIGSLRELNFEAMDAFREAGRFLEAHELEALSALAGDKVLTDDFAPVESLLKPLHAQQNRQGASLQFAQEGTQFLASGKLEKSLEAYQKAISLEPFMPLYWNNLANVHAAGGDFENARRHYEKALSILPDYAEAMVNLSVLLIRQNQLEEAEAYLKKALQIQPNFPLAYYNLGFICAEKGEVEDAIQFLERAVELDTNFIEAHWVLGHLHLQRKELDAARFHYQKLIDQGAKMDQAYNNLGVIASAEGNWDEAEWFYLRALEVNPQYQQAQSNLNDLKKRLTAAAPGLVAGQE